MYVSGSKNSDMHTYMSDSGGKKCLFFGKFGVLCFLATSVLKFTFLPCYQRTRLYKILALFLNTNKMKRKTVIT